MLFLVAISFVSVIRNILNQLYVLVFINSMNRYYKILISLFAGLAFLFLMEMDVIHHHADFNSHDECPVCVLSTTISAIPVLSALAFSFRSAEAQRNSVPDYAAALIQNYSSYYYPDRAPPIV